MVFLSDLQNIAQQISSLVTNSENATAQVRIYTKQVNEMIALINNAMKGTNQREYQELINQLNASKLKLSFAADCLVGVTKSGSDWLSKHVYASSTPAGTPTNFSNTFDFTSSESETYSNGDGTGTQDDSEFEEDAKVRKITEEEGHELYKNGLNYIDERLENHKEALLARGVPDGEWLRKTLAKEKALMTQQLANDIDVARGYAEPQDIYNIIESGVDGKYKFYDDMAQSYFNEKRTVGPCIDWKTQPECNKTNIELNLSKTNPNYSPDTEWSINCQRCVPTYEMRRRGYDVTAFPKLDENDYLCRHPFDVWKNPDVISTSGSGHESIVEKMNEWGDGARAQVVVVWKGVPSGHTFIVENVNGEVRFIDPQTGDENCSRYFNRVEDNRTLFCRIDDQVPSDFILNCCKEV